MRFPGHETVSIGNRVRVYAALNKVIIISILLSLFMTTAIYILPSKSDELSFGRGESSFWGRYDF